MSSITGLIERFRDVTVLVVGDLMLDRSIWGRVDRISPEAPVPVVRITKRTATLGGAANVVANCHVLGARVLPCGVIGKDDGGSELRRKLQGEGLKVSTKGCIVDPDRPTTVKTRIVSEPMHQQLLRFDDEVSNGQPIAGAVLESVREFLQGSIPRVDVVIIEDYGKGVITAELVSEIVSLAREHEVPVTLDPKEGRFDVYRGVTVITPNRYELSGAFGHSIREGDQSMLEAAVHILHGQLQCEAVLVTLAEEGMVLYRGGQYGMVRIPAVPMSVFDVSGAGDTVISVFSLALASGADMGMAAKIANCAAGVVVSKFGAATVTPEELAIHWREMGL